MARTLARTVTNVLNPFATFTALYALAALAEADLPRALLYLALELLAAAAVAAYVLLLRRRARVRDFWISARAERLTPALFLMVAFVALLAALALLEAPENLLLLTLSMGLASAAVALVTLFFKASAHCTVAGHAATAGLLVVGAAAIAFALALPLVVWARVAIGAHTTSETLAGAAVGAVSALLFLA